MTKYTFTLNGVDFSSIVEKSSYKTSLTPVYGEKITTIDGVDHVAVLRYRGGMSVDVNELTAAELASLSEQLRNSPVTVNYHCLQRNTTITGAKMLPNEQTARFLANCNYAGADWNEVEAITLTEL